MSNIFLVTITILGIVAAILVETTVLAIPFVYLISAFLLVFFRRVRVFISVFVLAFIIDSLRVSSFGVTAFFLAGLCLALFLYERYSGSDDKIVSSVVICASGIIYAHYLHYSVSQTLFIILLSGFTLYAFQLLSRKGILSL